MGGGTCAKKSEWYRMARPFNVIGLITPVVSMNTRERIVFESKENRRFRNSRNRPLMIDQSVVLVIENVRFD